MNKYLGALKPNPWFFFVLLMLVTLTACNRASAQSTTTYIHPRAEALMPVVVEEIKTYAPTLRFPSIIPAIFDHESCISYKHSKCWNTTAELFVPGREQGVGIGQMTRAWKNGTLRFDNLTSLRRKYPKELGDLSWDTFRQEPRHQVRASVFLFMEGYDRLHTVTGPVNRVRMAASAYNGGLSDVNTARTRCKLLAKCDHHTWYENVELQSPKSRKPNATYGGRSMYDINTNYVRDTEKRMTKFNPYFR